MKRGRIVVLTLMLAGLPAGCGPSESLRARPQQRVVDAADPDAVLAAAAVILQREFGHVQIDRIGRRIVTAPAEFTTARDSGTARDLYGGRSTMRHIGTLDVGRRDGKVVVRLRIDVQRRDTARQRAMHPRGHRLSDTPGAETPITRDAATTERQNTVWTHVRRDRTLERALLEELREQFARLATRPAVPATRAEPPAEQANGEAPPAETRD